MVPRMPRLLRVFLLLFLISLSIYANSMNGNFLMDDTLLIVRNEYIKQINTLPLLFNTLVFYASAYNLDMGSYSYYRPFQALSFALDYRIWRLNPLGYHLTNVAMHAFCAFLVFYLLYRLFKDLRLALLSSLLFCVNPLHTEAVSYISGRSELLVSMFALMSAVLYLDYLESRRPLLYLASIFSFMSALLSREAGFLILVPFFVLVAGRLSPFPKDRVWFHFFTFLGLTGIYLILRFTVIAPIEMVPTSQFNFGMDILNFFNVLLKYVTLFVFPHSLHILRTIEPVSSFWPICAVLLFLVSLSIALFLSVRQRRHALLFGITWFVLVSLYLIQFMYKYRDLVALEEHWAYLPSVGFFVVAAYFILRIKSRKLMNAACASVLTACAALTVINNRPWSDEIAFYRHNLKEIESYLSIIPRSHFVTVLHNRGFLREAMEETNKILAIDRNSWRAHIQAGDIFMTMKDYDAAEGAYRNALEIDYFCWQANVRLKALAEERGIPYEEELDPGFSPEEARIVSLIRMGRLFEAIDILKAGLSSSPTPQYYTLVGIALGRLGLFGRAIEAFNAALTIDPGYVMALYNLSVIYENKRDLKKASQIRQKLGSLK